MLATHRVEQQGFPDIRLLQAVLVGPTLLVEEKVANRVKKSKAKLADPVVMLVEHASTCRPNLGGK